MQRAHYIDTINNFLKEKQDSIIGKIVKNSEFADDPLQKNAWIEQIKILQKVLIGFKGTILFEYTIPRMGKRVDTILLINGNIIILEFKIGEYQFKQNDLAQTLDYALDLKYFHKESAKLKIFPVLICTNGRCYNFEFSEYHDSIFKPLRCNKDNFEDVLVKISSNISSKSKLTNWVNSSYSPTPTIIEAAQALYKKHDVREISRSDSGAKNLGRTTNIINRIIERSKRKNEKSICFITGVPGAGKTLAGLNIANERLNFSEVEHAVFLSGNGPLVKVLQEALARDDSKLKDISKNDSLRRTKAFIQNIHHFRDDALKNSKSAPIEKVIIFDEAQRAWNQEQTAKFMKQKKGNDHFSMSEPEFLISVMNRHKKWAVIVCLIGNGQEINTGEAGITEWFDSLAKKYKNWRVYIPNDFKSYKQKNYYLYSDLHLSTSIRSFRSENVSNFISALLSNEIKRAKKYFNTLASKFPIMLTRDINSARSWLIEKQRGTERIGIIASSNALRLKPYGIFVKNEINVCDWFLNCSDDIRSSNYLENVATEFDIQGLELDWTCVAWDANLRYVNDRWEYFNFIGTKYTSVSNLSRINYLINSYRVLLTRARQGMVIFVPKGNKKDSTRKTEFYNSTFDLLREIGLEEI